MNKNPSPNYARKLFVFMMLTGILFSALGVSGPQTVNAQGEGPEVTPTPTDEGDVSGQIVGGGPSDPGEWPWQVYIIISNSVCGGSLISSQWVLTAAHCVAAPVVPANVDVYAGIYNLQSPAPGYQHRDVIQIVRHPSYNATTKDSDIALLKLATPVILGGSGETKTATVPLVAPGIGTLAGQNSYVTGWGATESIPAIPAQLYEVQVPIIANTLCNNAAHYNGAVTSNMLCAGFEAGGKDSCQGDSGGPLVVNVDGHWQLAGIVSWGVGCADPGKYGVYTRVSNFVSWIDDYVVPELAIMDVSIYSPNPAVDPAIYLNDDINIEVTTQNIGSVGSQPFTVNIYIDGTPGIIPPATTCNNDERDYHADSAGLTGGEVEYWNITLPPGSIPIGSHTVTAYIDSGCAITEINKSDNVLSATFNVNAVPVSPPVNDSTSTPVIITDVEIPYAVTALDVRGATRGVSDPDNFICSRADEDFSTDAGLASVWYRYTPSQDITLYLDTFGTNYDTYIAVWEALSSDPLRGCNDDYGVGFTESALEVSLTGGTTYYFEVAQWSDDLTNVSANSLDKANSDVEAQSGGALYFHIHENKDVDVYINASLEGTYDLFPNSGLEKKYNLTNNGPVKIVSTNNQPIVASQRATYSPDGGITWTSYAEMMALPIEKITDSYIFPWYNNFHIDTKIRFANVDTVSTTVSVTIAGNLMGLYDIDPNQVVEVSYPNINDGPVKLKSLNGVSIIASEYIASGETEWSGYYELMGLPEDDLTDSYVFPWYNTVHISTQMSFANVGSSNTNVTVKIGGVVQGTYLLAPNQSKRLKFFDLNNGPVEVYSSGGVPIISSQRVAYSPDGGVTWPSYTELMGMPKNQVTDTYYYPWYNTVNVSNQISFANIGVANTVVTVKIGGVPQGEYLLTPNQSKRIKFFNTDGGSVEVASSNQVPIITSERAAYSPDDGVTWTRFAEILGLPDTQLSKVYFLPFYDDLRIDSEILLGAP